MSIRNVINEYAILPISDLLTGHKVYKYLHFLEKTKDWSSQDILNYQNFRFRLLIDQIFEYVPYYKELLKKLSLSKDDFKTKDDLRYVPIITKDMMRKEGLSRMTAENYTPRNMIFSHSSGSTGEPFSFYVSNDAYSFNTAVKLFTWYGVGYRLGDKYMKIVNEERHNLIKKIQDNVNNCIYVPFNFLDEKSIIGILDVIEKKKPQVIRSYPLPIYMIAQYKNKMSQYHYSPKYIMTTGATLTLQYREEIKKAFECDVIDSYSCEGTADVYETIEHDGYHIMSKYGIIEVLDENGNEVKNGIGRVVSTDLWNFAHPFVRYDTQDLVEVKDGIIMRVMGRMCESYTSPNGVRYTIHNFSAFFKSIVDEKKKSMINAYQVVRRKNKPILFRLVVSDEFKKEQDIYIIDYWTEKLGCTVEVEYVDSIPIMNNNKRLIIIDE